MTVIQFPVRSPLASAAPVLEPDFYMLEQVANGIEIALYITHDQAVAKFLLGKFTEAVNQGTMYVDFSAEELGVYLDYLDILKSPRNSELRTQLARFKYG